MYYSILHTGAEYSIYIPEYILEIIVGAVLNMEMYKILNSDNSDIRLDSFQNATHRQPAENNFISRCHNVIKKRSCSYYIGA